MYIGKSGKTEFGEVYYSEKSRANILSYARMRDYADELKEYDVYNFFRMRIDRTVYYFRRHPVYNVYLCNLDKDVYYKRRRKKVTAAVVTVSDQMRKYSRREVEEAAQAKDFMRKMGFGVKSLKKLIT